MSGNSTQCRGRLECLYVALRVCFWSDSDGERPKQIILAQIGEGGLNAVCFLDQQAVSFLLC